MFIFHNTTINVIAQNYIAMCCLVCRYLAGITYEKWQFNRQMLVSPFYQYRDLGKLHKLLVQFSTRQWEMRIFKIGLFSKGLSYGLDSLAALFTL